MVSWFPSQDRGNLTMDNTRFARFEGYISSAARSISRLKAARMGRFHLSAAHTSCLLRLLAAPDGLTQTGLRETLGLDRAQVSRVLHQLGDRGYVSSDGTGYNRVYRLTPSGLRVSHEVDGIVSEVLSFVSGAIPEQEIKAFYHTFSIITANLARAESRFGVPQEPQIPLSTAQESTLSEEHV